MTKDNILFLNQQLVVQKCRWGRSEDRIESFDNSCFWIIRNKILDKVKISEQNIKLTNKQPQKYFVTFKLVQVNYLLLLNYCPGWIGPKKEGFSACLLRPQKQANISFAIFTFTYRHFQSLKALRNLLTQHKHTIMFPMTITTSKHKKGKKMFCCNMQHRVFYYPWLSAMKAFPQSATAFWASLCALFSREKDDTCVRVFVVLESRWQRKESYQREST